MENPEGLKFCKSCQAVLPQIPTAGRMDEGHEKVMDRYYQVEEAVNAIKSGEITMEEFTDFLSGIIEILGQKEEEIRSVEMPQEIYEEFSDELEAGFEGMSLFNEGLAVIAQYLDDQNNEHLDAGMELCLQGSEKLNEAMLLNKQHKKRLTEMVDTTTLL
jgi:hypothetical protein